MLPSKLGVHVPPNRPTVRRPNALFATAESPSASMEDIYADLDNKTPCIFILSTGADPTSMLLRFAKVSGVKKQPKLANGVQRATCLKSERNQP